MSLVLRCPACGRKVQVPEPTDPESFLCPACEASIPFPTPDSPEGTETAIEPATKALRGKCD